MSKTDSGQPARFTIEVSWGEMLGLELERVRKERGITPSHLLGEVAARLDRSRNTLRKLLDSPTVPKHPYDKSNAVVLLLAVGCDLERFGLSESDLTRLASQIDREDLAAIGGAKIVCHPIAA